VTFLELYGAALDRELGSADTTQLFTTARRKAAINEAQREWVRATESFVREASISVVDGTAEYDLESSATDFWWIAPQGVEVSIDDGTTVTSIGGDDLPRRDIVWLNRHELGWRQWTAGRPVAHYIRQNGGVHVLGLVPAPEVPGTETWTLTVPYVAGPADMSADGDEPFTVSGNAYIALRPWHEALAHFAAGQLERLRKDTERSAMQLERFGQFVADYVQRQRRRSTSQTIVFARDHLGEASRRRSFGGLTQGDPRI
jgi:hypothetical protein